MATITIPPQPGCQRARTVRPAWRRRALAGLRIATAVGAILLLGEGCDLDSISSSAPTTCREAGSQCALPEGPLGVCERTTCAPGEPPPCFRCTPQH